MPTKKQAVIVEDFDDINQDEEAVSNGHVSGIADEFGDPPVSFEADEADDDDEGSDDEEDPTNEPAVVVEVGYAIEDATFDFENAALGAKMRGRLERFYGEDHEPKIIRTLSSTYRRAYLDRWAVLTRRGYDEIAGEIEIANPGVPASVNARQQAILAQVRESLAKAGISPEIIEQATADVHIVKRAASNNKESKRLAAQRWSAKNKDLIKERAAAKRAALAAARA